MTDPAKCPNFVRDYDCRSDDIDPKYHVLQQKVRHCAPVSVRADNPCRPAARIGQAAVLALQSQHKLPHSGACATRPVQQCCRCSPAMPCCAEADRALTDGKH